MDKWFEVVMIVVSTAETAIIALGVFILRDFRDRIMRLEERAMGESSKVRALR